MLQIATPDLIFAYRYFQRACTHPVPFELFDNNRKTTPTTRNLEKGKTYSVVQQSFSAKEMLFWQQYFADKI